MCKDPEQQARGQAPRRGRGETAERPAGGCWFPPSRGGSFQGGKADHLSQRSFGASCLCVYYCCFVSGRGRISTSGDRSVTAIENKLLSKPDAGLSRILQHTTLPAVVRLPARSLLQQLYPHQPIRQTVLRGRACWAPTTYGSCIMHQFAPRFQHDRTCSTRTTSSSGPSRRTWTRARRPSTR